MFPVGAIILWFGAILDIPVDWDLCDGTAGTPDLRNKFIVGAGDTYAPDDEGGSINHNHTFTTDGHVHGLPAGFALQSGADYDNTSTSVQDTGTTDNANGLPPYHALAFIMKN